MAISASRPHRVYLNGRLVPYARALVSVEDRGFLFGDGIYEVIRCYRGVPFRLNDHLTRLAHDAARLRIPFRQSRRVLTDAVRATLAANRLDQLEASVYIQLTRGSSPRTHAFPNPAHPTLVIITRPFRGLPAELRTRGARARSAPDVRSGYVALKSLNLLPNILAKQEAHDQGVYETIFVRDDIVTEGASTNVFAMIKNRLRTHPANDHILAGVTRQVVLELARRLRIPMAERAFTLRELLRADEVFLTASLSEIMPITHIDRKRIGPGRPGPITLRLWEAFQRVTREGQSIIKLR